MIFPGAGIAYDRLRADDPLLRARPDDAWRRYLAGAPVDDPGREAIRAAVAGP